MAYDPNNFNRIKQVFFFRNLCALPKKSPKGYNMLLYSVFNAEVKQFVFAEAVKAFCMFNDWAISEDGLSEG